MKLIGLHYAVQVALLLSVACSALARPDAAQNDFASLLEEADPDISDARLLPSPYHQLLAQILDHASVHNQSML